MPEEITSWKCSICGAIRRYESDAKTHEESHIMIVGIRCRYTERTKIPETVEVIFADGKYRKYHIENDGGFNFGNTAYLPTSLDKKWDCVDFDPNKSRK